MAEKVEFAELGKHKSVMVFCEPLGEFIKCKVFPVGTVRETESGDWVDSENMYQLIGKWQGRKTRIDLFDQKDCEPYLITT